MRVREIIRTGLLDELLEDESIVLNRRELELIDLCYCGDDEDIAEWVNKYGNVIPQSQHKIIDTLIQHIADNNVMIEMESLKNEYKDSIYNEYYSESTDMFKED